eukprot:761240-Hanusia_phi.AAC.1
MANRGEGPAQSHQVGSELRGVLTLLEICKGSVDKRSKNGSNGGVVKGKERGYFEIITSGRGGGYPALLKGGSGCHLERSGRKGWGHDTRALGVPMTGRWSELRESKRRVGVMSKAGRGSVEPDGWVFQNFGGSRMQMEAGVGG